MPLKLDGQDRGMTSVHVAPHDKLVEHRTVIREAWQLMSWLADDARVLKIDFGRVARKPANSQPRVEHRLEGRQLRLLFVGNFGAQVIELKLQKQAAEAPEFLIAQIEQRWSDIIESRDEFSL